MNIRSVVYLKSEGRTTRLTGGEKRTPVRTWKVYVRPWSVIVGIAEAMSGTILAPSPPAAFLNVRSPLFVASRISHPSLVYDRAESRWSGLEGIPARSVPPLARGWVRPPPAVPTAPAPAA